MNRESSYFDIVRRSEIGEARSRKRTGGFGGYICGIKRRSWFTAYSIKSCWNWQERREQSTESMGQF